MSDDQHQKASPLPRRGRPRVHDRLVPVSTWIHPRERDRLSRIALRRGQSESALLRQIIVIQLGEP